MPEKQKHGFNYEEFIINKYCLKKETKYTHKWDAYGIYNIPIQIKLIKNGRSIDLGDLFRNKEINNDFILHIGFWTIDKSPEKIEKCITLYINKDIWNSLYIFKEYNIMKEEMKLLTNLKIDDERSKQYAIKYKNIWKITNNIIDISFKRDHKKQMRWQCSINNKMFNKFTKMFKEVDLKKYNYLKSSCDLKNLKNKFINIKDKNNNVIESKNNEYYDLYFIIPCLINYVKHKNNYIIDYNILSRILYFLDDFQQKYNDLKCVSINKSKNKICQLPAKYIFNNDILCGIHSRGKERITLPKI